MKHLLTIFFLCFSILVSAQPSSPGSIKAGFGISRHTTEKINAPTLMLAFDKDFYPNTKIEISAAWALPTIYTSEFVSGNLENYRFGMALLYKVVADRKQALNLGIGFSAGFYSDEVTVLNSGIIETTGEFKPGFVVIAEYDFILPSEWFFGARASVARYDANRNIIFLGLATGLRF